MDYEGTISRGIRTPIIKQGDNLVKIVSDCVIDASKTHNFELHDKDVVAITEAIVARADGNYATIDDIADDVHSKFGDETVGLIFPIFSRNRFSMLLKGISKGAKKLVIQLQYPTDEVGNRLITDEAIRKSGVNPYTDTLTREEFYKTFGDCRHIFTGVDYIDFYYQASSHAEIIMSNDPSAILKYTKYVINADIHTRKATKEALLRLGATKVVSLDEILNQKSDKHGYNEKYGILGSNLATDSKVKLFPKNAQELVDSIKEELFKRTNKHIEVMVYGDGAFKDPVGGIWELADPVTSPGFTQGLAGKPNEIKLKYIADNELSNLSGDELVKAMKEKIKEKGSDLVNNMQSQGTTPRQITDLLASLSDLTSGSGDKGTPVILIQNYFKNFSM